MHEEPATEASGSIAEEQAGSRTPTLPFPDKDAAGDPNTTGEGEEQDFERVGRPDIFREFG